MTLRKNLALRKKNQEKVLTLAKIPTKPDTQKKSGTQTKKQEKVPTLSKISTKPDT